MAGEYTVKILNSEEFNKLPFKRIQEQPGSVYGAADVKTKTAYVLDTGFNDFTKANISHELDELMAGVSPHEEDGIRYKSLGDMFGSIGSGISKGVGAIGSGVSALGRGVKNVLTPGPAQAQGPTSQTSFPPLSGGAGTARDFAAQQAGMSIPNVGTGTTIGRSPSSGGGGIGDFFGNMFSKVGNMFGGGGGSSGGGSTPYDFVSGGGGTSGGGDQSSGQGVGAFDLFGSLKKAAPGALTSLAGNLFAPKVEPPDFSGIKSDLKSRMGSEGGSPAFDLGFGEAQRQLAGEPGTIPPAVFANLEQNKADEIEALENRFRGAQGGGGISESDTSRMGTLRTEIVKKYEDLKQQMEFEYQNAQESRRITTMNTTLNLDQAQFEQYTQLANLDIAELITQYGIDVQTATDFKELFGNVGGQMIDSAFQPQTA